MQVRPEAGDPTALEAQAASLRVARLAGPCPCGTVLQLLNQGLYLGSSLSLPCSLPRTRAFSFIFVCVCVCGVHICTYVHMRVDT